MEEKKTKKKKEDEKNITRHNSCYGGKEVNFTTVPARPSRKDMKCGIYVNFTQSSVPVIEKALRVQNTTNCLILIMEIPQFLRES